METYTIKIEGEAKTDYHDLKELDGIDCQDNFVEYLDGSSYKENLESGYLDFIYKNNKLYSSTSYKSNRKLTDVELADLADYTTGQWSDGIGEGFEQYPCYITDDDEEVYISPWFFGQQITITQTINK